MRSSVARPSSPIRADPYRGVEGCRALWELIGRFRMCVACGCVRISIEEHAWEFAAGAFAHRRKKAGPRRTHDDEERRPLRTRRRSIRIAREAQRQRHKRHHLLRLGPSPPHQLTPSRQSIDQSSNESTRAQMQPFDPQPIDRSKGRRRVHKRAKAAAAGRFTLLVACCHAWSTPPPPRAHQGAQRPPNQR